MHPTIIDYIPCRIVECYYDDGTEVIIGDNNYHYKIRGTGAMIWRLIDGECSIENITRKISLKLNLEYSELLIEEVIEFIKMLEKKQIACLNWNPSLIRNME